MKLNWGTNIVIAFVAFIVFILSFVVKTFTQPKYEYDLVTETYYQEELAYQNTINHAKNTHELEEEVRLERVQNKLVIVIPNKDLQVINGNIKFYRPSNQKLDFVKQLNSTKNTYEFTNKNLVKGRWDIIISWSYGINPNQVFYKKESIYF